MRFHKLAAQFLILLALFIPAHVQADPVVVTEGVLTLDSGDPSFFRFTTADFSIFAVAGYSATDFAPYRDCFLGHCSAGSPLDPSAQITRAPLNSTDSLRGVFLNGVAHPDAVVEGHILISGPTGVVPEIVEGSLTRGHYPGLILDASLTVYRDASRSGAPLLMAELLGRGFLTARFESFEPGRVQALDLTYQFGDDMDPVPEPGTLLLFASGAACLFRRKPAQRS